jgi:hypothetical protein
LHILIWVIGPERIIRIIIIVIVAVITVVIPRRVTTVTVTNGIVIVLEILGV